MQRLKRGQVVDYMIVVDSSLQAKQDALFHRLEATKYFCEGFGQDPNMGPNQASWYNLAID